MNQRIEYIDLAKGVCIMLVVLLHVFGDTSGTVIKVMNLFRMPLYFVLSGLFFKTYDGLRPFLKKKTNKLLIPFLSAFVVIILPTTILLNEKAGIETTWMNLLCSERGRLNLGIDGAIWFLLCLFFVNTCFYLIFLLSRRNVFWIGVVSFLCGVAGYALHANGLYLPLWMDSSLTALPFFYMGYAMRKYTTLLQGAMGKRDYVSLVLSFAVLIGVYAYDEWRGKSVIAFGENNYDIGILPLYVGGLAGTYMILMIAKHFTRLPFVSYVGRYSIVVLMTHLIYMFVLRNLLYQLGVPQDGVIVNLMVFVVIMLLSWPTIKYAIKYLPYCFAQKDLWR